MSNRHTRRRKARINELAEELSIGAAIRLRVDSDQVRPIVNAVVAYLTEEYPAQDLYIPSCLSREPTEAARIRADLTLGMSMRQICRKYRRDRRSIYRLIDCAGTDT